MDKETIIKGCENWVNNHKGENLLLAYSSVVELLAVLKEPKAEIHFHDTKTLKEYLVEFGVKIGFLTPEKAEQLLKEHPQIVRCKYCINRHDSINCRMFSEGMNTSDDWFVPMEKVI